VSSSRFSAARRLRGPLAAAAQQPTKRYRIGMLETISPALNTAHLDAFRKGLRELGYVEGKNYAIEYRSADGRAERFPELAAELVRLGVDLIVVRGTPATIAAKNATRTIPVIMASVGDPLLIVDSLAHPGRNVTGLSAPAGTQNRPGGRRRRPAHRTASPRRPAVWRARDQPERRRLAAAGWPDDGKNSPGAIERSKSSSADRISPAGVTNRRATFFKATAVGVMASMLFDFPVQFMLLDVIRHCERSEAIQSGACGTMDCFDASLLAMTRPSMRSRWP